MSNPGVSNMSSDEKISEALKRSLRHLGPEARREIEKLLNPKTLAIVAGVLAAWVVSHFFGVGEIVDAIIVGVGVLAIGLAVFDGLDELYQFASCALNASSEAELDKAGLHFSRAVAILGVQTILTVLLKSAPKTFKGRRMDVGKPPTFAEGPMSRPPLTSTRALPAGAGQTGPWGEILISRLGTSADRRLVAIHESIHRLLTPKLRLLRRFRVANRASSYNRSSLSKYLEEAIAETAAQVGVNGITAAFRGVAFPVQAGYVTIFREVVVGGQRLRPFVPEAGGLCSGGFIFGGIAYEIWWTPTAPKATKTKEFP
jgi:hypothetical protein